MHALQRRAQPPQNGPPQRPSFSAASRLRLMPTVALPTYDWDHPDTARFYEEFCRRHTRYQEANRALVDAAGIQPGMKILDVGAGTGRTAESALPYLYDGQILCVEPAEAMRQVGQERLTDSRIRWSS